LRYPLLRGHDNGCWNFVAAVFGHFLVRDEIFQSDDFGCWFGDATPALDPEQIKGVGSSAESALVGLAGCLSLLKRGRGGDSQYLSSQ
jgi:hypothetical protein